MPGPRVPSRVPPGRAGPPEVGPPGPCHGEPPAARPGGLLAESERLGGPGGTRGAGPGPPRPPRYR
eukprot:487825-Hanusia_phi.AAC.1